MVDESFVIEAARLAGLPLGKAEVGRVQAALERVAGFAELLEQVELSVEDELAPIWQP